MNLHALKIIQRRNFYEIKYSNSLRATFKRYEYFWMPNIPKTILLNFFSYNINYMYEFMIMIRKKSFFSSFNFWKKVEFWFCYLLWTAINLERAKFLKELICLALDQNFRARKLEWRENATVLKLHEARILP